MLAFSLFTTRIDTFACFSSGPATLSVSLGLPSTCRTPLFPETSLRSRALFLLSDFDVFDSKSVTNYSVIPLFAAFWPMLLCTRPSSTLFEERSRLFSIECGFVTLLLRFFKLGYIFPPSIFCTYHDLLISTELLFIILAEVRDVSSFERFSEISRLVSTF